MRNRIIKALETAEILGVCDYLIHNWDVGDEDSDSEIAFDFSFTDEEGQIFEFEFDWEALDNAVISDNCVTLTDSEGESVEVTFYQLTSLAV